MEGNSFWESLGDRRQRARLLEGWRQQGEAAATSEGGLFDTDGCVDQSRSHPSSWSALHLFIAGLKWGRFYDAKKVCTGFQVGNLHAEPRTGGMEKEEELTPVPSHGRTPISPLSCGSHHHPGIPGPLPILCGVALVGQAPLLLILIPLTHAADGG